MRLFILIYCLLLVGCASPIDTSRIEKTPSYHLDYADGSRLDKYLQLDVVQRNQQTGFLPLNLGHDALLARIALIDAAEQSIDVQYYIYRDDESSQLLSWKLYKAAQRGVRVRILLDDMQNRNDSDMARFSHHPNIQVRLFNPHQYRSARSIAMISDFSRLNRRMHNKSLTVDGITTILGGRNIGNEYFSVSEEVEFGDFDLLLVGSSVESVSDQFDLYWNSDFSVPIEWLTPETEAINDTIVQQWNDESEIGVKFSSDKYDFTRLPLYQDFINQQLNFYWADAEVLYDRPEKMSGEDRSLIDSLSTILEDTEQSLLIISPYFVPTEEGTTNLIEAKKRGIDIIVVTNSLASNDVFAVHGWYAKYRKSLVENGIQLWEIKANAKIKQYWSFTGSSRSSLHAKAMIIDKQQLFVGSMNWDPRSVETNTELGVILTHPEYCENIYLELPELLKRSAYQVQLKDGDLIWVDHQQGYAVDGEPDASIWRKMGAWFSGILPIEELL
ncbi:phospholipase D family protein [Vibrio sp. SCSIO 43136]|uniref:phospholipase D family protein n=1 Tax=Vibrio sp. SCSIO 43136 TaxID=2819101 RepID=UPI0020762FBF|nr:phospholipase D family protein [Vibrio sp. SCSIO 43136]USD66927.1 phospholipase D family protein [Vibrio sp. SCSIO 43136]